jgi:hypothetical protein
MSIFTCFDRVKDSAPAIVVVEDRHVERKKRIVPLAATPKCIPPLLRERSLG